MLEKKFYNIDEMSDILGKTIASIYGHLARKQYDAVPMPIKLGRRLAWVVSDVDEWIEAKLKEAYAEREEHRKRVQAYTPTGGLEKVYACR